MTLGQKLKKLRTAKGLTQHELAKIARVGSTTIVYAEAVKGEKRPARYASLRFETLLKIVEHLDVRADSKAFQELAILWLEEQLGSAISAARARKACKSAGTSRADTALEQLVEDASQNLKAEDIALLGWAAREPRAIKVLRTLKEFQGGPTAHKPAPKKRQKMR